MIGKCIKRKYKERKITIRKIKTQLGVKEKTQKIKNLNKRSQIEREVQNLCAKQKIVNMSILCRTDLEFADHSCKILYHSLWFIAYAFSFCLGLFYVELELCQA